MAAARRLALLLLLLVLALVPARCGALDVSGAVRSTFLSVFALRQQGLRSTIVDHFFTGLEEIKLCATHQAVIHYDVPAPRRTWYSMFSPVSPSAVTTREIKADRTYVGCVIGTVRSSAAAYMLFSNAVTNLNIDVPGRIMKPVANSVGGVYDTIKALTNRKMRSKMVKKAAKFATKYRVMWK